VKILLTGKTGQVGWELSRALAPLGELSAHGRAELDVTNPEELAAAVRRTKPDVIVNAAAYTAVDRAESEPQIAFAVNAMALELLAEEARRADALLIHYSTDYVFDGSKTSPYTEEDQPAPLNVYGQSKLEGENAIRRIGGPHLILRTSWVYAARGHNFFLTMRRLMNEGREVRVVSDQIGAPTSARALADATAELIGRHGIRGLRGASGIYHATAAGDTSWYGLASEIARLEGAAAKSWPVPISSAEYPARARRPTNSRLSNEKLHRRFHVALPPWQECLAACHAELKPA